MPHVKLRPTFNLDQVKLDELQKVVPEAFADGKINWETLRAAVGQHLEEEGENAEHFGLNWPGKRKARHLAFTPSTGTLVPVKGEGVNEEETKNIFIEGENLEVLKLLQKSYAGKIKMIYIDPPYNTGNDFIYPDNFTHPLDFYLKLTGQKDAEGNLLTSNPETSGRFHSAWLSMIYPRLSIARQLLQDDGLIFVSIDDHEQHDLRMLMNEIFGEENFVAQIVWKGRQFQDTRATTQVSVDHEYIMVYSRSTNARFIGVERDESKFNNPDNDPRGPWMSRSILGLATKTQRPNLHFDIVNPASGIRYRPPEDTGWRYSKERMQQLVQEGCILFPSKPDGRPREKKFRADLLSERMSFRSIIDDIFTAHGTAEIRDLFGFDAFDFPKPSSLIRRLIEQGMGKNGIVLDFFAGSCSTAQAVLAMNLEDEGDRCFVAVQLPEPTQKDSAICKAGFQNIAEIGKERIRRALKNIAKKGKKFEAAGFRVFRLAHSNFRTWQDYSGGNVKELEDLFNGHKDPLRDGWKKRDLLTEILLHEGVLLTAPVRKEATVKKNDVLVVASNDRRLLICLDENLYAESLEAISLGESDTLICLDSALTDEQKLRLSDKGLLKTI